MKKSKIVLITGAAGLIGRHAQMVLASQNGAARFKEKPDVWEVRTLNRDEFNDRNISITALVDVDLVLHFAGINRASDEEVEAGNIEISEKLVSYLNESSSKAHVIYANSIQAERDNPVSYTHLTLPTKA